MKQVFGYAGEKRFDRIIGKNQIPVAVDGKCREGHLALHHGFDGLTNGRHIRRIQ
ncbi:hypothetical protein D3C71_1872840 [compost metagenome]